jgi:hypothetical protein
MSKTYIFPLDRKKFSTKGALYAHIEESFPNLISDQMPPSRLYFNLKYGKTTGKCVMTGKPTLWNTITERYERFADDKAKEAYREMFKKRMMSTYGSTHILDDPEQQKKMLNNRSISIDYKWASGEITRVNSKLEERFLLFVESTYRFNSACFTEPPTIYYKLDNDTSAFYLPDFFIPSLNLIIEIKGSNPHYQERDKGKEALKERYTKKEGFAFVQVNDENYLEFNDYFMQNVLMN